MRPNNDKKMREQRGSPGGPVRSSKPADGNILVAQESQEAPSGNTEQGSMGQSSERYFSAPRRNFEGTGSRSDGSQRSGGSSRYAQQEGSRGFGGGRDRGDSMRRTERSGGDRWRGSDQNGRDRGRFGRGRPAKPAFDRELLLKKKKKPRVF